MAMYTGIEMYKKIPEVEDGLLQHVEFYSDYISILRYHERNGGYPHIEYMMDELGDEIGEEWEGNYDDSDEAYYAIHSQYIVYIERIEKIVQQIDKHDLTSKIENEEVYFTSRKYPLAYKFGELFNFPEFYHRKLVDADELIAKLDTIDKEWCLAHKCSFEWAIEKIKEHKDEWVFEVHVS